MQIKILSRKLLSCAAAILVAFLMASFLAFPARYGKCVLDGLTLWALSVLPSALPFLFLTSVFTGLSAFSALSGKLSPLFGKLFRVSGAGGCAALLSAISGYPVGAKTVGDLASRGILAKSENFRVAALATTTGPAFLVGAVGCGMFKSAAVGWILFLCHLLGVWSVAALLGRRASAPKRDVPLRASFSLSEALSASVTSVLCVGGAIALFSVFGQMLCDLLVLPLPPVAEGVLRGLLEMTTGCSVLSQDVTPLSLALCCFLVTFGGVCVLVQQLAFLSKAGVAACPFLAVKLLQGAVAGGLCYAAALLLL